jgi:hypothetical protein
VRGINIWTERNRIYVPSNFIIYCADDQEEKRTQMEYACFGNETIMIIHV